MQSLKSSKKLLKIKKYMFNTLTFCDNTAISLLEAIQLQC